MANLKKLRYGKTVYYKKHPRLNELSPLTIEGFRASSDGRTVFAYGKDEDGYHTDYHDIRELVTSRFVYLVNRFLFGEW